MSSKKRRIARKIAQLVRMYETYHSMSWSDQQKRDNYWRGSMKPLAWKLSDMGKEERAKSALRLARAVFSMCERWIK